MCKDWSPKRGGSKEQRSQWTLEPLLLAALAFTGASEWPAANTLLGPSAQSQLLPSGH